MLRIPECLLMQVQFMFPDPDMTIFGSALLYGVVGLGAASLGFALRTPMAR